MNILIYIPDLKKEHVGGVWQYSAALIKILASDHTNKYFIFHNADNPEILNLVHSFPHLTIVKSSHVHAKSNYAAKVRRNLHKTAARLYMTKTYMQPTLVDLICTQYKIDIIHSPIQYIPLSKTAKLITTLHDVQEIHFPEHFLAEERAYRANAYLDFVRRADAIIVSYGHIKDDLIKYFQVPASKISVILLDMQKLWFERLIGNGIYDIGAMKFPAKFLLYPANVWKHKNHLRLVEAVWLAREKYDVPINLICTGGNKEKCFEEVDLFIKEKKLESNVQFTGAISEEILYTLYKTCRGVVIPTMYEAGSFPLIESIMLNAAVICSNVTSLPDTIGSDEFLFDPTNVEDMAAQMIKLWTDDSFRQRNIANVKQQEQVIRNNHSLEKLQHLYSSLNDQSAEKN